MRLYVGTKLDDANKHTKTQAWTYKQRSKYARKQGKPKEKAQNEQSKHAITQKGKGRHVIRHVNRLT